MARGMMVLKLTSSFRDHNEYVCVFMDCIEAIKPFIPFDSGCTVCMMSGETYSVFETANEILEHMGFDGDDRIPLQADEENGVETN